MITPIFTSKKLEKLTKKLIVTNELKNEEICELGKWNATVFYVYRKKCWLVTNSHTRYSVILPNIQSSDLSKIDKIFKNKLHTQMTYDGVIFEPEEIDSLTGTLKFYSTDNDRRTIGFQNSLLSTLDYRREQYGLLENWPLIEITHYLNDTPFHWDKPTMTSTTYPVTELKIALGK